ncbi:MAG: hypothetical protein M1819_007297 [Sarea resinae]|nr:MAG: hypothetical protein M1819_007297 [Sarea resinae]
MLLERFLEKMELKEAGFSFAPNEAADLAPSKMMALKSRFDFALPTIENKEFSDIQHPLGETLDDLFHQYVNFDSSDYNGSLVAPDMSDDLGVSFQMDTLSSGSDPTISSPILGWEARGPDALPFPEHQNGALPFGNNNHFPFSFEAPTKAVISDNQLSLLPPQIPAFIPSSTLSSPSSPPHTPSPLHSKKGVNKIQRRVPDAARKKSIATLSARIAHPSRTSAEVFQRSWAQQMEHPMQQPISPPPSAKVSQCDDQKVTGSLGADLACEEDELDSAEFIEEDNEWEEDEEAADEKVIDFSAHFTPSPSPIAPRHEAPTYLSANALQTPPATNSLSSAFFASPDGMALFHPAAPHQWHWPTTPLPQQSSYASREHLSAQQKAHQASAHLIHITHPQFVPSDFASQGLFVQLPPNHQHPGLSSTTDTFGLPSGSPGYLPGHGAHTLIGQAQHQAQAAAAPPPPQQQQRRRQALPAKPTTKTTSPPTTPQTARVSKAIRTPRRRQARNAGPAAAAHRSRVAEYAAVARAPTAAPPMMTMAMATNSPPSPPASHHSALSTSSASSVGTAGSMSRSSLQTFPLPPPHQASTTATIPMPPLTPQTPHHQHHPSTSTSTTTANPNQFTPTNAPLSSPMTPITPTTAQRAAGFINFTPSDSRKLLTGVAPSGSSKTKARREKEAEARRRRGVEAALRAVSDAGGDVEAFKRGLVA